MKRLLCHSGRAAPVRSRLLQLESAPHYQQGPAMGALLEASPMAQLLTELTPEEGSWDAPLEARELLVVSEMCAAH